MSGKAAVRIDKHKRLMTRIAKLAESHVRTGIYPEAARYQMKRLEREARKAYILEDERREWTEFLHKMETQIVMSTIERGVDT